LPRHPETFLGPSSRTLKVFERRLAMRDLLEKGAAVWAYSGGSMKAFEMTSLQLEFFGATFRTVEQITGNP